MVLKPQATIVRPAAVSSPLDTRASGEFFSHNRRAVFGPAALSVQIVDMMGRTVFRGVGSAGKFIEWNCRSKTGEKVVPGEYLARIRTFGGIIVVQKLLAR